MTPMINKLFEPDITTKDVAAKLDGPINFGVDGSCNGSEGGFAFVGMQNDTIFVDKAAFMLNTTNNRMEMMAMISCLEYIKNELKTNEKITVFTDSGYVFNTLTKGWYVNWFKENKERKNMDLWQILAPLYESVMGRVTFTHVHGHSDFKINEIADERSRTIRIKAEQYNEGINS